MEQNMPRFTLSFLIGCIFIGGCNLPSTDQSIPEFDSKPVVWLDEWPRENEISKGRRKAETLLAMGDKNKRARNFGTAEMHYKFASDADPTWAYPAYQTACAFDLWGKPEEAAKNFQKAIDLGFDDYPTVLIDDDLVSIRKLPNFDQSLQKIRDNYITNGTKNVGQPIAIPATGNKPPGGWPMILLLHGYADSNLRYLDKAKQWAALGFVAVAVPGSTPLSANAFRWNSETIETTQKDLQSIVQSKQFDGIVNREKVYLLGFSQGALHAILLTAEHPDLYQGVIAISPGGPQGERLASPGINSEKGAARLVFIQGTGEPDNPFASIWGVESKQAGWKYKFESHNGGHHFPADWENMRPDIAKFLLEQ